MNDDVVHDVEVYPEIESSPESIRSYSNRCFLSYLPIGTPAAVISEGISSNSFPARFVTIMPSSMSDANNFPEITWFRRRFFRVS